MNHGTGLNSSNEYSPERRSSRWYNLVRLLVPGLNLKRWLVLGAAGISIVSVGIAFLARRALALNFPDFLPGYLEGVLLLGIGFVSIVIALYGLYRSLGPLILASTSINRGIANTIYTRRSLGRGPRIVVIGGGTGLSVLLKGLKRQTDNLTAIVTVGDDGGSSGRLRKEMGILPPGDFRNCLVAMSDAETLLQDLFQYRFDQGDGLKGHSFGNLFIVAMTNVTDSFEQALLVSSQVLGVRGSIVPATTANLQLSAELANGTVIDGESNISEAGGDIRRLHIVPADAAAHPPAVEAIANADFIVIGPGSLYTSILPNLVVGGINDALRTTRATKIYVCNVVTQMGETEDYSVADHHEALVRHTFPEIVDYVVANNRMFQLGSRYFGNVVRIDDRTLKYARLYTGDLTNADFPARHDSEKLAQVLMDVYHETRKARTSSKAAMSEK